MPTLKYRLPALLLLAGMGFASTASAALINRGGGMIYDTDLNITWLADANLNGSTMNWAAANTWAAGLTVGGYTDWRLPTTLQPDASCDTQSGGSSHGYNCTGSELGHLFYGDINHGLGGMAFQSITTTHNANYGLFNNIQASLYWSGTEYAPNPGAWIFDTGSGNQDGINKDFVLYGWAVRSGDVAAAVPEPGSLTLLVVGLAGWIGGRRRRG